MTKDVQPYTIVGGVPARPIRKRYNEETIDRLHKLQWWDWPAKKVKENLESICAGKIDDL